MNIKSGFQAVQEAIDRSQQRGQGGGGFLPYLIWKDDSKGEGKLFEKTVRFLTDEVVPCEVYEFIPCKDGKMRDFIVPSSVGIEGPDIVEESGILVPQFNNKNNLVKPRKRSVTFGIAAVREERSEIVDGRRTLTYHDKYEKYSYEKDGKTIEGERQVFGLLKQSNSNFWSTVAGYWSRYGTITDRDYVITRKGNGVDTNYTIIPCDPIPELRDPEDIQKHYKPPVEFKSIIEELASPERAERLLLGKSGEQNSQSNQGESPKEDKVDTPNDTEFSDFRRQLLDQG